MIGAEISLKLMAFFRRYAYCLRVTFYTLVSKDQAALVLSAGLAAAFEDRFFCRSSSWPKPTPDPQAVEIAVKAPGSSWEHYRCYPTDLPQAAYYRIPLPALAGAKVALNGAE